MNLKRVLLKLLILQKNQLNMFLNLQKNQMIYHIYQLQIYQLLHWHMKQYVN